MNLTIIGSNAEVDKKIKSILMWILPTKGNAFNTILENPKLKSQTIKLDGRTIVVKVTPKFISIDFGQCINKIYITWMIEVYSLF